MATFKSYCIGFILLSPYILQAQGGSVDIPHAVKIQFMEDYISASEVNWQKEQDNKYTVIFFYQSHYKISTYSSEGDLLLTRTNLRSLHEIPPTIAHSLASRYKKYTIDQIDKIETVHEITFEFIVRKEHKIYQVTFESSGKLRRRMMIK